MAAVLVAATRRSGRGEEGAGMGGWQEIARIPLPVKLQCCGGGEVKRGNTSESLLLDRVPAAARFAAVPPAGLGSGAGAVPRGCQGDAASFPTLLRVTAHEQNPV